jgi:hypothetical protein
VAAVSTTVSATIAAPRAPLYAWLVRGVLANELETVSRSTLGIAGVAHASEASGPWDVPGSYHTVFTTDGSQAREEVTAADAPGYFAYRVTEFTQPMIRRLATEARGQWAFADDGSGTSVRWTYSFQASAAWALPVLFPLIKLLFRRYMTSTLRLTRARAEAEVRAAP